MFFARGKSLLVALQQRNIVAHSLYVTLQRQSKTLKQRLLNGIK